MPARGPLCPAGPAAARGRGRSPRAHAGGKVCRKGVSLPPAPHRGLRAPGPSRSPRGPSHRAAPGRAPARLGLRMGAGRAARPRAPGPRVACPSCPPAVRTRGARRSQLERQLEARGPAQLGARGGEGGPGREAVLFCFSSNSARLALAPGARLCLSPPPRPPPPGPRPAAPSGWRLAPGPGEAAQGRPGHRTLGAGRAGRSLRSAGLRALSSELRTGDPAPTHPLPACGRSRGRGGSLDHSPRKAPSHPARCPPAPAGRSPAP